MGIKPGDRILSIASVTGMTGLSKTTIWRLSRRREFPRSLRLSPGRVGWSERAILRWLGEKDAASRLESIT